MVHLHALGTLGTRQCSGKANVLAQVALYVFEMIYRTKLGWELWLHHCITVVLSILAVQTVREDGSVW